MKILLAGEGGQGVQTVAEILTQAYFQAGWQVANLPNFGVEQRGGVSLAFLQIERSPIAYPKFTEADMVVEMVARATPRIKQYVRPQTKIINTVNLQAELQKNNLPPKSYNMVVLGILVDYLGILDLKINPDTVKPLLEEKFKGKKGLDDNLRAFAIGVKLKPNLFQKPLAEYHPQKKPLIQKNSKLTYIRFPYLCKGCGLCLEVCPVKSLSWSAVDRGVYQTPMPINDLEKCTACGLCERFCPDTAIRVDRKS